MKHPRVVVTQGTQKVKDWLSKNNMFTRCLNYIFQYITSIYKTGGNSRLSRVITVFQRKSALTGWVR